MVDAMPPRVWLERDSKWGWWVLYTERPDGAEYVPAQALTTTQAQIEALRSLVGDVYETLKRIEQCAEEPLVAACAKDACDKIDATLGEQP